jgi:hypothetical protein
VNFLLFLHKSVVLGDASKGKLIHEIDFVRISHVFVLILQSDIYADFTTIGKVALNSMTWRSLG